MRRGPGIQDACHPWSLEATQLGEVSSTLFAKPETPRMQRAGKLELTLSEMRILGVFLFVKPFARHKSPIHLLVLDSNLPKSMQVTD